MNELEKFDTETLEKEIERRNSIEEETPLTISDIKRFYRLKSRQAATARVIKEGIEEGNYIVKKVGRQYLIDKKSFMKFWNGGERDD